MFEKSAGSSGSGGGSTILLALLALILGAVAVVIAMSMRSHIISLRTTLQTLKPVSTTADDTDDTADTEDEDDDVINAPSDENTQQVETFTSARSGEATIPYIGGTERVVSDPLVDVIQKEPPRNHMLTSMGLDNPFWDEEGYATEQMAIYDAENPMPSEKDADRLGRWARARIGTEWEYSKCPSCLQRYNYRGTV